MGGFQKLMDGLGFSANSLHKSYKKLSEEDANRLITKGGAAMHLGQQWIDGAERVARGRKLSGWFVGRIQNAKAQRLVSSGLGMQRRAEAEYAKMIARQPNTL